MKKLAALSFCAVSLLTATQPAFARVQEQIKNYRGIRSSGMGGVITTTGNFSEALFGNPARLAVPDVSRWTLFELTGESNTNLVSDAGTLGNIFGASGADTIANASKIIGRNQHFRAQVFVGHFNPRFAGDLAFGFGLLATAHSNLLVNYTTDIDAQIISDAGPVIGAAYPFFNKRLLVGASLRLLYRAGVDDRLSSLDFLAGKDFKLENFGHQGFGIDGDLGAYYRIPWEPPFMRVGVGLTFNNLMKSHYDEFESTALKGLTPRPPNNDRTVNFGFRFGFPDTNLLKAPQVAIEFQDLGSTSHEMSVMKSLHLGAETRLSRVFTIRSGINEGYLTAGVSIDLPLVKFDLATYGEELTGTVGELEDRRVMFRLGFEI